MNVAENKVLAAGLYSTGADLATELQTKVDILSSSTITCTYSENTKKFTITCEGGK